MEITYDEAKRQKTLIERDVDFRDAVHVFKGETITFEDTRFNYGEKRMVTIGYFNSRMTIIIWTERANTRRIISMRKANGREQLDYSKKFEERALLH